MSANVIFENNMNANDSVSTNTKNKRKKTDNLASVERTTVKLNVGGKNYEVSRSLLCPSWGETMLSRLISDEWMIGDPNDTIFIDRDGDMFGHVLNYLRYGDLVLPNSVSTEGFCRELDYYGIPLPGSNVHRVVSTSGGLKDFFRRINQINRSLREMEKATKDLTEEKRCILFGYEVMKAAAMVTEWPVDPDIPTTISVSIEAYRGFADDYDVRAGDIVWKKLNEMLSHEGIKVHYAGFNRRTYKYDLHAWMNKKKLDL